MYILNNQEKAMLKIIVKNAKIDYIRKNRREFETINIDGLDVYSNENIEKEIINKIDEEIQAYRLEEIFDDQNMFKNVKALTYSEKLVLFLYFIKMKNDEEIAKELFSTRSAINKKRLRAIEKIRKELLKKGRL